MTKFAVVCASNQNRSMEAHRVLLKKGFDISSYGTGKEVKLPGPSINQPNVYPFGTPYNDIYEDLDKKNHDLYTHNGLLNMLDRNRKIKRAPERFRDSKDTFDVIVCCEERCFDQVCEDLANRGGDLGKPVHVINFDITDNQEDAAVGATYISQLCQQIVECDDLENKIDDMIEQFEKKTKIQLLHSVNFY